MDDMTLESIIGFGDHVGHRRPRVMRARGISDRVLPRQ